MGGDADATLRRAARFADGWSPWLTPPDQLPARLDFLRSQPGFDDRPFEVFYSLAALSIGADHVVTNDPNAKYGDTAEEIIDQVGTLKDLGVTFTSVMPPPVTDLEGLPRPHALGCRGNHSAGRLGRAVSIGSTRAD